jgi:hypothetical protein
MELHRAPTCPACGMGLRILPTTQLVAADLADEAWLASLPAVEEARLDVACENGHASVWVIRPARKGDPAAPLESYVIRRGAE